MNDLIERQTVIKGLTSLGKARAKSDAQKSMMGRAMLFVERLPSVSTEKTAIDCSDSICRADAIKLVKSYIHEIITESGVDKNSHTNKILTDIVESLAFELPPVSVAEKTGRWIYNGFYGCSFYECSECGFTTNNGVYNYCPNCGTKMEV